MLSLTDRFEPLISSEKDENILSYENSSIFLYSTFVYLIVGVVFSTSTPYRKPLYTNCKGTYTLQMCSYNVTLSVNSHVCTGSDCVWCMQPLPYIGPAHMATCCNLEQQYNYCLMWLFSFVRFIVLEFHGVKALSLAMV